MSIFVLGKQQPDWSLVFKLLNVAFKLISPLHMRFVQVESLKPLYLGVKNVQL